MSILDIKEKKKELQNSSMIMIFLAVSVIAVAINNIYAIFGHGVSSSAMNHMFLYPLLGGVVFYLLIEVLVPRINSFTRYRLFCNIYNSGIAVLTVGSFLKGILEIAGTDSKHLEKYFLGGWLLVLVGMFLLMLMIANYKK